MHKNGQLEEECATLQNLRPVGITASTKNSYYVLCMMCDRSHCCYSKSATHAILYVLLWCGIGSYNIVFKNSLVMYVDIKLIPY